MSSSMPFITYKDLEIGVTNNLRKVLLGDKAANVLGCSFYYAMAEDGFAPLGHLIRPGKDLQDDPNLFVIVARDKGRALALPTDYEIVWRDDIHNSFRFALWRPVPPPGYVAMGLVATMVKETSSPAFKPAAEAVRCISAEYVISAKVGPRAWTFNTIDVMDKHQDGIHAWEIVAPPGNGGTEAWIAPGTFTATAKDEAPKNDLVVNALRVKVPVPPPEPPARRPTLTSHERPSEFHEAATVSESWLPFYLVNDPDWSTAQKIARSKKYKLKTTRRYVLINHHHNNTSQPASRTWDVRSREEKSESTSMSHSVGISMTTGTGMASLVTATVTVSYQFGYQTTTTVSRSKEEGHNIQLTIGPEKSVAAWYLERTVQLFRADGSQVGPDLVLDEPDSSYSAEFPPRGEPAGAPQEASQHHPEPSGRQPPAPPAPEPEAPAPEPEAPDEEDKAPAAGEDEAAEAEAPEAEPAAPEASDDAAPEDENEPSAPEEPATAGAGEAEDKSEEG